MSNTILDFLTGGAFSQRGNKTTGAAYVQLAGASANADGSVGIAGKDAATEATPTNPVPVADFGVPSSATGAIAASGSLSGAIAIQGRLAGLILPAGWTAQAITFQGSVDGGVTFVNIYDDTVERTISQAAAQPSRFLWLDLIYWLAFTHIKIRSGTAAAPVNQTNAVTITAGLAG